MKPISGIVITFNEENSLRDCLESLSFVDEIIVVDSKSTDQTVAIAREYTDKVYIIDWDGYAASKNFGIDRAENDWVLSLDADERISDVLRHSIRNQNLDLFSGYRISRRTWYMGRWITGGGWYPDEAVRLFDRNKGRFRLVPVHEKVDIEGETGQLEGDILHYSYRNISDHVHRIDRYTDLISETWFKNGRAVTPFRMINRSVWDFFRRYVLRKGFKDGKAGVVLAGMQAFYTFLKFSKTIERHIDKNQKP
jgi:glycosyltransferase involved in cell wall biosynthesis